MAVLLRLSRPAACRTFLDQGPNPRRLCWQADSDSVTREAPDRVLVLPSIGEANSELDAHILTTGSQFGHTMHDTVNPAFSP